MLSSLTSSPTSCSSESLEDTEAPVPSHEKDIREDKVRRGQRPCAGEGGRFPSSAYGLMTQSDSQQSYRNLYPSEPAPESSILKNHREEEKSSYSSTLGTQKYLAP